MSETDPILEKLNPAQRDAVTMTDGPVLVIAGAGSGKTRVITHRIAYLVRSGKAQPWQIFASTFTNKAAEEMKHRIAGLLPGLETARLTVGTFHAICVTILRREASRVGLSPRFTIADDSDQLALVKDCLKTLDVPAATLQPQEALQRISAAKTLMLSPADARRDFEAEWGEAAIRVYERYEERLTQNNAVDFDDLLLKVVRLFQADPEALAPYQERWRYFLIDEYQDINGVQFELIRLLSGRDLNICAVGDEDQSIYSWRGADIENILRFPEMFPGTRIVRLEQNYRSTETILEAANAVISRNRQRHGKNLWSARGRGEPIALIAGMSEREEAALVVDTILELRRLLGMRLADIAIFYRVNALSRLYEDFLRQARIPYRVIGGIRFYDRAEIKDLLAYLRLAVNPADGMSLMRIINKPRRGIGEKTLTAIVAEATRRKISLWEALGWAVGAAEIPKKAQASLANLAAMIRKWQGTSAEAVPGKLLDEILRDTAYEESLGPEGALETVSRRENVDELGRALEQFREENPLGTLDDYLEMVTLASAVDQMTEDDDCVSLMTLHSAKGLEFPCVFMTGLEESIFPSARSTTDPARFEEERRLFYVGVTRAKDRLFLCRADSRSLYGGVLYNPPSTFLMEIPKGLTQSVERARQGWLERRRDAPPPASARSGLSPGPAFGEPPEAAAYPPGTRVRHATLGEGQVMNVRGEGIGRKIAIRFDAGVEVEVLEKYGGLERVGDLPF